MIVTSSNGIRTPSVFVFPRSPLTMKVSKLALSVIASIAILALVKPPLSVLLASVILVVSVADFLMTRDDGEAVKELDSRPSDSSQTIVVVPPREPTYITLPIQRRLVESPVFGGPQQGLREPVGRRLIEPPRGVRETVVVPEKSPLSWRSEGARELVGSRGTGIGDENPIFKKPPQGGDRVPVGSR